MSILVNKHTRIITQGISGKAGYFHTEQSLKYGSKIVGGVVPGKGGTLILDLPVFDTVFDAKRVLECNASMIFVPAPFAAKAILEAEEAGIELIICITEGIPINDMLFVKRVMSKSKTSKLIGPNSPGIITPGECRMGIMTGYIHQKGSVGIVSRSGTLNYEAALQITRAGLGQSTCVGIGGDPVVGVNFVDILKLFEKDPQTKSILMIGEVGGTLEEEAAEWIKGHATKPIVAFIAGSMAPTGHRMGHAGAIVQRDLGSAKQKIDALRRAGVAVTLNPAAMGQTLLKVVK
ncbi:MAG: succinate--CoA ligase subunit alpha [Chlamydiales bacterium]|nr:succinate--CoA ligase subunit alpha [Chlamydiales bacterium]